MERILMKLEVNKSETLSKLNELFRKKVQLEEEQKENETQLQFHRGVLAAFEQSQKVVREIQKGEQVEKTIKAKSEKAVEHNGSKEEAEAMLVTQPPPPGFPVKEKP